MSTPNTKITATYRIPYDVDEFWNDGCKGTDFVPDTFGNSVVLLTSDSGSMYVCPENISGEWRSYIDPCGYEIGLNRLPGEKGEGRKYSYGWPSFWQFLSCGFDTNQKNPPVPESVGECTNKRSYARTPTMFKGMKFNLFEYAIKFENGAVSAKKKYTGKEFTEYVIDERGIPWKNEREEREDSNGYYPHNSTTMATSEELQNVIGDIKKELPWAHGAEKPAAKTAIRVFESALELLKEIEVFEESCEQLCQDF